MAQRLRIDDGARLAAVREIHGRMAEFGAMWQAFAEVKRFWRGEKPAREK